VELWIRVRAALRVARLSAMSALLLALLFAGYVPLALAPAQRLRWRRWIMRRWARAMCAAIAVQVEVEGELPPPGSFLVCNHLSYVDIAVIASVIETVFVSKAEVAGWPGVGVLARAGGTIFVERARKRQLGDVNRQIQATLARGDGVVVFPEGTSTKGESVLHFRPSLLAPAAEAGLSVRCASLSYRTAPGDPPPSLAVCWWGDAPFTPHVLALLKLERIDATLAFPPESVMDADRKALSEKLWSVVKSNFRPVP
jgi:1-acyl-sn-glycerol-3-phosphate acyltransferase